MGQRTAGQKPAPERDRVPGRAAGQHHRQGVETRAAGAVLGEAGLSSPLPPGGGAGGEGPGLSDCYETTYGPESSRPLPNPLPSWERELVRWGRLFRGGQRTVPFLRELPSSAASASKQNSRIRALSPLPLGRGAGGEGRGFSD